MAGVLLISGKNKMNRGFTSHLSELGEFAELSDALKKGGMYELSGVLDVAKGQIIDALSKQSDGGRKLVVFASEKRRRSLLTNTGI